MRLLVTRPAQDGAVLAQRLAARGHSVMTDPLLTVTPVAFTMPDETIAAIVLTSRHGARALADSGAAARMNAVPVHCVGAASAEAARAAGFRGVVEGGGDAAALANEVGGAVDRTAGVVVHVRGRHTRGGIAERLALRGFKVREVIAYEARAADVFAPETRRALGEGAVDGVLLFSTRTAETFASLVAAEGLAPTIAGKAAFCLSRAVAVAIAGLAMKVCVPGKPTLDALIDAVGDGAGAG